MAQNQSACRPQPFAFRCDLPGGIWAYQFQAAGQESDVSEKNACIRAAAAKCIPALHGLHRGKSVDPKWKAVWIKNKFLRAMVLLELGGRIHKACSRLFAE